MEYEKYLVVLDYGTGGLWQAVFAESATAITDQYPELDVIDESVLPQWMSHARYLELRDGQPETVERLDETPKHLLAVIRRQRLADMTQVGSDRPIYTVGYDNGSSVTWTWLRANTETQIRDMFPTLKLRHGRNDVWFKEQKAQGLFDSTVHDIDDQNDLFLAQAAR